MSPAYHTAAVTTDPTTDKRDAVGIGVPSAQSRALSLSRMVHPKQNAVFRHPAALRETMSVVVGTQLPLLTSGYPEILLAYPLLLSLHNRREKVDGSSRNNLSIQIVFSLGEDQLAVSRFLAHLFQYNFRLLQCDTLNEKLNSFGFSPSKFLAKDRRPELQA
jgi:hypothetical protein